jgi:hypothetical protein
MADKLDKGVHKLDPKLRMIANCDEVVNALRAEQSSSVIVKDPKLLRLPLMREAGTKPVNRSELPSKVKRGKLREVPDSIYASLFVELKEGITQWPASIPRRARSDPAVHRRQLIATELPLSELEALLADPNVVAVESAERILFYPPLTINRVTGEPAAATRQFAGRGIAQGSQNVLIGIIDVQGFDFAHPDFLDANGQTRFVTIWDQGGSGRPAPKRFGYGSELTQEQLNRALKARTQFNLPATQLEPQSQMVPGSHATHVASIAAGNHGLCPQAKIAGVLISVPK